MGASFEMLDAFYDIGTGCSLAIAGRDSHVDIVAQGEFPAACEALFPEVTLTIYQLYF